MTTFSDIIANRHLNLKDEILTKLDGSDKIKFAVGYLYLSGFYQIADKLENLKDAKLLIGSSNLTMSGFFHNTELNTYVRGQKNYEELIEWIDRLWEEGVPFEETLQETFEESWALKTVNPYDVLKRRDQFSKIISSENRKTRIEPEVRKVRNRLREIMSYCQVKSWPSWGEMTQGNRPWRKSLLVCILHLQ